MESKFDSGNQVFGVVQNQDIEMCFCSRLYGKHTFALVAWAQFWGAFYRNPNFDTNTVNKLIELLNNKLQGFVVYYLNIHVLENGNGLKVELVSKELNHFGVIADLFWQIGGHSSVE